MQVNIFSIKETGEEYLEGEDIDLAAVFEFDDPEYGQAMAELANHGRYWVGGGAAPLLLLMRA